MNSKGQEPSSISYYEYYDFNIMNNRCKILSIEKKTDTIDIQFSIYVSSLQLVLTLIDKQSSPSITKCIATFYYIGVISAGLYSWSFPLDS